MEVLDILASSFLFENNQLNYMTEQEINSGNRLIAEFMGYQILNKNFQYLNYSSSNESYWEWDEGDIVCDEHGNEVNFYNDEPLYSLEDIPFKEWNVLMTVVEKIESITFGNTTQFDVVIDKRGCCITQYFYGGEYQKWQTGLYNSLSKIESVWLCCVNFIKFYNTVKDATTD